MARPVAIQRYIALMQQKHGISAKRLLADSGIDGAELGKPGFLVEQAQSRIVVNNLLQLSGDKGAGLDVWLNTLPSELGIVGYTTLTSRSLRDSYPVWRRFGSALVGITGSFHISEETDDSMTFTFEDNGLDRLDPLYNFYIEEILAFYPMFSHQFVGKPPPFTEAELSYRAPAHEERYHQLFNCPVRFGASQTRITLDRSWFDNPGQSHDEELNKVCRHHCDELLHQIESSRSIVSSLRGIFLKSNGSISKLDDAARELNMSSRTLRRRLLDEGTTYTIQVDTFRMNLAREYLRRSDLSTKEVAFRLGFKEPTSFRHAFKMRTGQTIGEYRAQVL
ncbi:AraC family transcriptional regulator [Noviherbaspirillum sedimenti]|uniref:AraC family transcriptional regulator n=1 Tax=Noviherbaspirillum sedimenti TaxID=2320865 RepID=A0A3A3GLQ5_9BURK|nr:AraC family transcriptional regulator [Noviherbaspirillum sedimenti]RJG03216.1 AraC family transcriptional regulator [Noviherbaspirillum sedimenti]